MTDSERLGFGPLLRQYRSAAGLTQEDLAQATGLSVRGISALETGNRSRPHWHTVQQLAEALHLEGAELNSFRAAARESGRLDDEDNAKGQDGENVPPDPSLGKLKSRQLWFTLNGWRAAAALAILTLLIGALTLSAVWPVGSQAPGYTVAFLAPEASGRWVQDKRYIEHDLKKLAPKVKLLTYSAGENITDQTKQAKAAMVAGAKVLILAAVDQNANAPIVNRAAAAGVHVIAYDRMIQTDRLEAYDSFNGPQVGEVQGRWLAANISKADIKKHGNNIVQIWGAQDDNNALLYLRGFEKVFGLAPSRGGPTKDCKKFRCPYTTFTPYWGSLVAGRDVDEALAKVHKRVAGVYSMDDNMSAGIEPELAEAGLADIPLTGQDATPDALARILTHKQGMTVYKPLDEEALPAARTAVWWLEGKRGLPSFYNTKSIQSKQTDGHRVMSIVSPVFSITRSNVGLPVAQGLDTWAEVCANIADAPDKPYCGFSH